MRTKYLKYIILIFLNFSFCLPSLITYGQENQQQQERLFNFDHDNTGKLFFIADWQINYISNDFVDDWSGWGANMELNYYLNKKFAVGVFLSWSTNNKYFSRRTYVDETYSITTDMQRGIFQLPFGVLARYDFISNKLISPYALLKVGASYSEQSVYLSSVELYNRKWGFYVSPEIGVSVFPFNFRSQQLGLHVGAYYGFATNSFDFGSIGNSDNLNNIGFRLGVSIMF